MNASLAEASTLAGLQGDCAASSRNHGESGFSRNARQFLANSGWKNLLSGDGRIMKRPRKPWLPGLLPNALAGWAKPPSVQRHAGRALLLAGDGVADHKARRPEPHGHGL